MKKTAIVAGDIFAFDRYDGSFGFGRVVLDIENQCVKRRLLPPESPLLRFAKSVLIDIYRESASAPEGAPTEIAVRGVLVSADVFKGGKWPVIGQHAVDPTEVEFPENLVGVGVKSRFTRGEVSLPLSLSGDEIGAIDVYPTMQPSDAVVHASRFYSDASAGTTDAPPALVNADLRFSPERKRVYELLGEDPGQSYHEMATKHGHDTARFYR